MNAGVLVLGVLLGLLCVWAVAFAAAKAVEMVADTRTRRAREAWLDEYED